MDVIHVDDSDTTACPLTKEGIFEKVMWGRHLTSAEKAFVLNAYRPLPVRSADAVHLDGAGQASSRNGAYTGGAGRHL